jgi:hypothetical protein
MKWNDGLRSESGTELHGISTISSAFEVRTDDCRIDGRKSNEKGSFLLINFDRDHVALSTAGRKNLEGLPFLTNTFVGP